jgi:hypothetical protein
LDGSRANWCTGLGHPPTPPDFASWQTISFADSVSIASADIARQALDAGLVDEVNVSLVPVLLGTGIPYLAQLRHGPHRFHDPVVIAGKGATHLRYAVRP